MRWEFVIQQKLKAAVMLAVVMLAVVVFNLAERRNIAAINQSVTSIYNDRLVPATDIFYLTEKLYNKRFEMEKFLSAPVKETAIIATKLSEHNKNIDLLIRSFGKTYLVSKEHLFLKDLRLKVNRYNQIEKQIFSLAAQGAFVEARNLYETEGRELLRHNISNLAMLTKIQTEVGNELMKDSEGILATSDMLSTLQMVLVIIIGIAVVSLITISKAVSVKHESFNLN